MMIMIAFLSFLSLSLVTSMITAVVVASMPTPAQSAWSMPLVISGAWRASTALALIRSVQSVGPMSLLIHPVGWMESVIHLIVNVAGTCICTCSKVVYKMSIRFFLMMRPW